MTIITKLIELSELYPERVIIQDKDRSVNNSLFISDIYNAASSLKDKKVLPESNVMIHASNTYAFICSYFAVHLLGARSVVVAPNSESSFLTFVENKVNPAYIVSSPEDLLTSGEGFIKPKDQSSDSLLADILFTSGTTGEPKGVPLSHLQIFNSTQNIILHVCNTEKDVELLLMPLSHSFALGRMRSTLLAGTILVIGYPLNRMKQVFKAIETHNVTGFGIVPAAWEFIVNMSRDKIAKYADQIKYVELGSAHFSPEKKEVMKQCFPNSNLVMHYGLTEVSRAIFSRFHHDPHDSIGVLDVATEIRILDPALNVLENGVEGEISLRTNWMFSEYLDNPDLTNSYFSDGFFRTGDLGVINSGYLYLRGRLKEVINVGGKKVNPNDVEVILKKIDGISDCACVAHPDPHMGEVVKAFIVINDLTPFDESSIKKYIKEKLPNHMRPQQYEYVEGIPRTANGKIQRLKLLN